MAMSYHHYTGGVLRYQCEQDYIANASNHIRGCLRVLSQGWGIAILAVLGSAIEGWMAVCHWERQTQFFLQSQPIFDEYWQLDFTWQLFRFEYLLHLDNLVWQTSPMYGWLVSDREDLYSYCRPILRSCVIELVLTLTTPWSEDASINTSPFTAPTLKTLH